MKANQKLWENKAIEVLNFEPSLKNVDGEPIEMNSSIRKFAPVDNKSNHNIKENRIEEEENDKDKMDDDKNEPEDEIHQKDYGSKQSKEEEQLPSNMDKSLANSQHPQQKMKNKKRKNHSDVGGERAGPEEETSKKLQYIDTDYPEPTDADDALPMIAKQKRTVEYISQQKNDKKLMKTSQSQAEQQQQQQQQQMPSARRKSFATVRDAEQSMPKEANT